MPRESIGTCGASQSTSGWAIGELELGICYIRHACGEPPEGYELGIIRHEHELADYPTIGINWDGPYEAPWDYIRDAEGALRRFDEAVDWEAIEPAQKPKIDDVDEREPNNADADATPVFQQDTPSIELYRRVEMLELDPADWRMALLIFKEMGWTPERPVEAYFSPLVFVKNYEGEAMHKAGEALFAAITEEPFISTTVQMDLGMFYRISEFVASGAFIVGKKGAYAEARRNGDL